MFYRKHRAYVYKNSLQQVIHVLLHLARKHTCDETKCDEKAELSESSRGLHTKLAAGLYSAFSDPLLWLLRIGGV